MASNIYYEVIIHGVPIGHKMYSKKPIEGEKQYLQTLYSGASNDAFPFMQIDILRTSLTNSVYYHFVNYANIINAEGRPGSFVGISLRIDNGMCKNVHAIYNILEMVYHSFILGNLLKQEQGGIYKYSANDLNGANCDGIINLVEELVGKTGIFQKDLIDLPNTTSSGAITQLNRFDNNNEQILSNIIAGRKTRISNYYPNRQTEALIKDYERKIADKERQVNEVKSEASSIKTKLDSSSLEVKKLSAQIDQLKKDSILANRNKDISDIVGQIKEPIKKIASLLPEPKKPATSDTSTNKKKGNSITGILDTCKTLLPFINFLLLAALVVFLYFFNSPKTEIPTSEGPEQPTEISEPYTKSDKSMAETIEQDNKEEKGKKGKTDTATPPQGKKNNATDSGSTTTPPHP